MKKVIGLVCSIIIPVFILMGATVNSAIAEEKVAKADGGPKILAENDKVKAWVATYNPGVKNVVANSSSTRIVRALKGGTMERTYEDGKKEKIVWKTGDVKILDPGPAFTNVNVGKSDVQLYIVQLK